MSTSVSFVGSSFSLLSVTPGAPGFVRVRFTADPLQASALASNDGLNINNYVLAGPTLAVLEQVLTVSGDPQSLDLKFTAPLAIGTWAVSVANVQTPALNNLVAPTSLSFTISQTGNATSFAAGAENDDPEKIIRKHLNPALKGDNWNALIAGLSRGDAIVREQAELAFDQLWINSSSGKYLDRNLANVGIRRPTEVGLDDPHFRKLGISLRTRKITHESIREILEVFYGRDALRAWASTSLGEPFALNDGQYLEFTLDEDSEQEIRVDFDTAHFQAISQATAAEVATVITKAIRDAGSDGFADVVTDSETGDVNVRIYSGSLGIKSFVRVTGGDAQPSLRFQDYVEVYDGDASGLSWAYTLLEPGVTRLTLAPAAAGIPAMDVTSVQEGDYVVVSTDAASVPGVYSVKSVGFTWTPDPGAKDHFVQTIDLTEDIGFTGAAIVASNDAYRFFRPAKQDTLAGAQSVVVAQTIDGTLNVVLPATSEATTRGPLLASYLNGQDSVDIVRLQRDGNGLVTVDTASNHGLSTGDQVIIDDFVPAPSQAWVSPPAAGNLGGSYTEAWASTTAAPAAPGFLASTATLIDGTVLSTGGLIYAADAAAETATCARIVFGSTSTVSDGSQAEGADKVAYTLPATASMSAARHRHGISVLTDGAHEGQVLVTGGLQGTTVLASAEIYDPNTDSWTSVPPMSQERHGHQQVTLDDGRVLVCGGSWSPGNALASAEIYDPITNTWSDTGSMSVPRVDHQAVTTDAGLVLTMGGRTLGQATPINPYIVGYWKFDEDSGNTAADASGYGRTLTGVAAPGIVPGKIGYARDFSPAGSYMSVAGDVPTAAFLAGPWSTDFWLQTGLGGAGDETIVAYGAAGVDATQANNTLIELISTAAGNFKWRWEHGAGVDVTGTSTATFPNPGHFTVTKTLNGIAYDVRLYYNGVLQQTWAGQTAPDGGTDAAVSFYVAYAPETGAADGWRHELDDLKIWAKVLSSDEIRTLYLRGVGTSNGDVIGGDYGGDCNVSAEQFDPNTGLWTSIGNMETARANFRATVLDYDRIMVCGGLGYNPTQIPALTATTPLQWPLQSLASVEVQEAGRWYPSPDMPERRHGHYMASIPGKNIEFVGGGHNYTFDDPYAPTSVVTAETQKLMQFGRSSETWSLSPLRVDHASGLALWRQRNWAQAGGNDLVVVGGGVDAASGNSFTNLNVLMPGTTAKNSGGGINAQHRVTRISDTQFTFETPAYPFYSSNLGASKGGGAEASTATVTPAFSVYDTFWIVITNGVRASNVTTLELSELGSLAVGDTIYANTNSGTFTAGVFTITAVDASVPSISYADAGPDLATAALNGALAINYGAGVMTAVAALQQAEAIGPYTFDPADGLPIVAAKNGSNDVVTTTDIVADQQYTTLAVDSATDFPDQIGYVVLDFGGPLQSQPIKYIEKISPTVLLLDYNYVAEHDWPAGTVVTLLSDRSPATIPAEVGGFYATGSNAGRVAAQQTVTDAAGAGFNIDFDVVYPGDRGLGGEGLPAEGDGKLSDKVRVWGPDDLDEDV